MIGSGLKSLCDSAGLSDTERSGDEAGLGVLSTETKVDSSNETFSHRTKLTAVGLRTLLPTTMLLAANGPSLLGHCTERYRSKGERAAQDSVRALGGRSIGSLEA